MTLTRLALILTRSWMRRRSDKDSQSCSLSDRRDLTELVVTETQIVEDGAVRKDPASSSKWEMRSRGWSRDIQKSRRSDLTVRMRRSSPRSEAQSEKVCLYGLRQSDGMKLAPLSLQLQMCNWGQNKQERCWDGGQPTRTLFKVEDIVVCIHLSGHKLENYN